MGGERWGQVRGGRVLCTKRLALGWGMRGGDERDGEG
jgi:hypothetical protein